jgi:hypothetical protein
VVSDVIQVQQDSTGNTLNVLPNDFDSEGMPLSVYFPSITPVSTTHGGTVKAADDFLSLVYTPASGYFGADTLTYAIVNNFNRVISGTSTVLINKTGNQAPTAGLVQATMTAGASFIDIDISAQVSDPDAADIPNLTLHSLGTPRLGTVAITGSKQFRYTRGIQLAGEDTFIYRITDGKGGLAVGSVRVDRNTGSNHAPVAESYSMSVMANQSLLLPLPASDPDGNPLTYTVVQAPQHGTLMGSGNSRTYTPANNYNGPDFFTFKVSDGSLESPPATVTLHVQYLNQEPVATPSTLPVPLNAISYPITLAGWDLDGDRLQFIRDQWELNPAHGSLSGTPPNLTYTPVSGYTGWDKFTFRVNDRKTDSLSATVALYVRPVTPSLTTARKDTFQVTQNTEDNDLEVLANDGDAEHFPLIITAVSSPAHGTACISSDRLSIIYTPSSTSPAGGFFGVDSFTYTIDNGQGRTAVGNVTVFVAQTGNSVPTANASSVTLGPGQQSMLMSKNTLLAVCSDPDSGDVLTIHSTEAPEKGSTADNGQGAIVYTRTSGRFGRDAFDCIISDGRGGHCILTILIDQADTDGDGFPDDWETAYGFNPSAADNALADADGDGLSNLAEFRLGSDPTYGGNPLNFSMPGGSTVSGVVSIPLAIGPDASGFETVALYINGSEADSALVEKDPSGSWKCMLDTTSLPNGEYWMELGYAYPESDLPVLDANLLPYDVFGAGNSVRLRNAISFPSHVPSATTALHFEPQTTNVWGTWSMTVYDDHGNSVTTLSGIVDSKGKCLSPQTGQPGIDVSILDAQGNQLPSTFYTVALATYAVSESPSSSGGGSGGTPAQATKRTYVEKPWPTSAYPGLWSVAYYPLFNPYTPGRTDLVDMMNVIALAIDYSQYKDIYSPPIINTPQRDGDQQVLKLALPRDWGRLYTELVDPRVRNFVYTGHFSGGKLGGASAPKDQSISEADLRAMLKNHAKDPLVWGVNQHPYRFVFINACNSASAGSQLPQAFGIPKKRISSKQMTNLGFKPRAFLGWKTVKPYGYADWVMNQDFKGFAEDLFIIWPTINPKTSKPYTLEQAVNKALENRPGVLKPVIYGCPDLKFFDQ